MMQVIKHLRDFMTEEALKSLPGYMQARTCILLKESLCEKEVKDGITHISNHRVVLHVFDESGNLIGTIEKPHYIPK